MSKKGLKIVTIGGGSSYTPELVEGFIKRYDHLPVTELWLVDIEAGHEKLEIVGNDHIITVNGYASTISLQGTGNKITVNSVKSIDITGVNNKLYYKNKI